MSRLTFLTTAISLVACIGGAAVASAVEYRPVEEFAPSSVATGGRAADILGIVPGTRCSAANETLKKIVAETGRETEPEISTLKIQTSFKGLNISTVSFDNRLEISISEDKTYTEMSVGCTGIASGNQVVGVSRKIRFNERTTSPTVEDVMKGLIAKYGEPSGSHDDMFETKAYYWTYRNGSQFKCINKGNDADLCSPGFLGGSYDIDMFERYMKRHPHSSEVYIRAELQAWSDEPSRAKSLQVSVDDRARRAKAAKTDMDSIFAEAERKYRETAKSVAAPKL